MMAERTIVDLCALIERASPSFDLATTVLLGVASRTVSTGENEKRLELFLLKVRFVIESLKRLNALTARLATGLEETSPVHSALIGVLTAAEDALLFAPQIYSGDVSEIEIMRIVALGGIHSELKNEPGRQIN